MGNKSGPVYKSSVARSVPYDDQNIPTNLGDTVQEALDNLYNEAGVSASPGFSWGASGNITANTWLINDTVPSNKTGRNFPLYNGTLELVSVANEIANTFSIEIYEHDGTIFTLLATVSLTAERSKEQAFTGISITKGKELAIKQVGGSSKNPVVQVIAKGTRTP
jgi:hypothetical protein